MMPVIAIRPEPGCTATVELGVATGIAVRGHPLFVVEPVAWQAPSPDEYDAVLLGSANAVRQGGSALSSLRELPALCVGEATAQTARDAGFEVALTGAGGLQAILPEANAMGFDRLLRLSGEAHVPLDPPAGMRIDTLVCYRVAARPVPADLQPLLRGGALVLLHSGEAAAHFAAEIDGLGIDRKRITLACLAPRIAVRAGEGWAALSTAPAAEDAALLALARQMCQA
ncbi:uroporphyrinogen-III synthase [Croceicoccus bisphenolivorans]|uniref:uroporphyrinogen-III synthase n=1 Tax=Croceicoccus bisphenolivorans TaxID=1783232 RepID=UPI00082A4F02|nr:uroporphyrinogen-III synthase [Croceicoccus bisphenolivorans]